MPSPIGHALGGAIVGYAMAPKGLGAWGLGLGRNAFTVVAIAAVLPDIDFAEGAKLKEFATDHGADAQLRAGNSRLARKRYGRKPHSEWNSAFRRRGA